MAKRALSEALSPDQKPSSLSETSDSNPSKPTHNISYASSAENIARLLKGWMKNPPKKTSITSSAVTHNSFNNLDTASSEGITTSNSVELSETFESLFGFESLDYSSNSNLSTEATTFQEESKPEISGAETETPFYLLEKWLLDDAACQDKLISCADMITSVEDADSHFF